MRKLLFLLVNAIPCIAMSQGVGIGTNSPNVSAQLEISATNKGLLIPRMRTAAISGIINPAKGLMVLDTAKNQLVFNIGTPSAPNWQTIAFSSGWNTTGNAGTNAEINFIGTTDNTDLVFKRNNLRAGLITNQRGNTSWGHEALQPLTTGSYNTAIGTGTLFASTSGSNNTALGFYTLLRDTSGSYNTASGSGALFNNTTGDANNAFGYRSLFSNETGRNNTAIGVSAGDNTLGSSNVFIGFSAGKNETGSNKLYISNDETNAANTLLYGEFDNKILSIGGKLGIGTTAPENLLHLKNDNTDGNASQLIIEGNSSFGDATTAAIEFRSNFSSGGSGPSGRIKSYYTSNNFTDAKMIVQTVAPGPAFVDAMTLTDGKVGIGTTTPHGDLHLPQTLANRKIVLLEDFNNDHQFNGFGINTFIMRYQAAASTSSHVFYAGTSSTSSKELMRITGNGEVGIGKIPLISDNDSRFQIKQKGIQNGIGIEAPNSTNHWDYYVTTDAASNLILYYNGSNKGGFDNVTGAYTANSDRRLKKDITPYQPVLTNVMQLQAYQYHYIDNQITDRYSNGFMAQDVQKLFPDAVVENTMKNGETRLGINYQYFTVLAIKSLQEQQQQIDLLKAQMKTVLQELEKNQEAIKDVGINDIKPDYLSIGLIILATFGQREPMYCNAVSPQLHLLDR